MYMSSMYNVFVIRSITIHAFFDHSMPFFRKIYFFLQKKHHIMAIKLGEIFGTDPAAFFDFSK